MTLEHRKSINEDRHRFGIILIAHYPTAKPAIGVKFKIQHSYSNSNAIQTISSIQLK